MAPRLPSSTCTRSLNSIQSSSTASRQQVRHASLLRRPHRPYTFTQLITLSDGSTFTHRTTSPAPIFKSTKDTLNHPMWQPSLRSLRNVEDDEAGRLRSFREKFGRGWDVDGAQEKQEGVEAKEGEEESGSLMDLISGYKSSGSGPEQTKVGNEPVKKAKK